MRIVILDDLDGTFASSPDVARLRELGDVVIYPDRAANRSDLIARLQGAEVVVANRERTGLNRELLSHCRALRFIAQTGTGYAHLDVAAARDMGIMASNTPGGSADSVVELTFALMLSLAWDMPATHAEMQTGAWPRNLRTQLRGKALGVVGLGRIGTRVASVAREMGMSVLAAGPTLTPERAAAAGVELASLDALLGRADVVTLHLRLVGSLHNYIGARELSLMKPSAFLINTARGALVDEGALIGALRSGRIAGAGLDVYAAEPLPDDSPLRSLRSVVLSSHQGGYTDAAQEHFARVTVENIRAWVDGRPENVITGG